MNNLPSHFSRQSSSPVWSSPLATPPAPRRLSSGNLKPRKLEFDQDPNEVEKDLSFKHLSDLYKVDFLRFPLTVDAQNFFVVREIVMEIEEQLEGLEAERTAQIRQCVVRLLQKPDGEDKAAELGLILFYLERDQEIPEAESLLFFRSCEMEKEVCKYLDAHQKACDNPLIPSGKTHYLMRALAHMALTSRQFYNRGGVLAIKQLLNNPACKISKHLQPEHRSHILNVVDKLVSESRFEQLFQKRVRAHPALEDVIRWDLKLGPEEAIYPVHVLWDSLLALFADVRQQDEPNCYAVSALIYATEHHPFVFLTKTLEWLERGHVTLGAVNTIPILPLLEKRLEYHEDLTLSLCPEKALSLTPICHIKGKMKLDEGKLGERKEPVSIQHLLKEMLRESNAEAQQPYVEKMYFSFKFNCLVHLHLALIEVIQMNEKPFYNRKNEEYSHPKEKLLDACLAGIVSGKRKDAYIPQAYLKELKVKLGQRLWLENCNESTVRCNGHSLEVRGQVIKRFDGNPAALKRVLRNSLRVFDMEEGRYTMLHTFSDLQRVIGKVHEMSWSDFRPVGSLFKGDKKIIAQAIASDRFRIHLSNYCSKEIRQGVSGKHLNWADVFVLNQLGGFGDEALGQVYGIQLSKERIGGCYTPYQFLERLLEKLEILGANHLKPSPKVMIFTPGRHVWTLSPHCWSILIDNQKTFLRFVEDAIFTPAKKRMCEQVPLETVERIIESYAPDAETKLDMRDHFQGLRWLSYARLQQILLDRVNPKNYAAMEEIIENEFSKISMSPALLKSVMKELALDIDAESELFGRLCEQQPKKAILPYHLARSLRTSLIEEGIAILQPYEIEQALCKVSGLPLPIEVGDLNWVDAYREDPYHLHLVIKYSWCKKTPHYVVRDSEREEQKNQRDYQTFELYYPQVPVRKYTW